MIRTAINRPVAILMLFLALVLMGLIAWGRLPVDLLPAINYPNLTVITNWSDTPADDLTRLVTQPLEEAITGLAGVRQVLSRTREGISTITVQYEWGTEMDFANLHLREALDRVSNSLDFPEEADRPLILRWDPSARPIAILVLEGDDPLVRMTEFGREVVKPALEQIQGISQAELIGGAEREILVRPDFAKLRLYGLTVAQISQALAVANISFPGGRIRQGPLHLPLRILGEFEDLQQIRQTEIPGQARGLTIGDVAEVLDTTKEPEGATLLGGREVLALHLYKEIGENTIRTTEEVDRILGIIGEEYEDFRYSFVYRDADFVQESFQSLGNSLLLGACLAFLVLVLFLSEFRSPTVVSLAIPVSVATAIAFLYFADVSLNLMSLGGLSLATGMLVDNSIVVLENITRHRREKPDRPLGEVCASATSEVAMPVVASTLTTVAVFFPVIYVPGIAGEFFRDQALTVTISLLVSILAALLLQPMVSARLLSASWRLPRRLTLPLLVVTGAFLYLGLGLRGLAGLGLGLILILLMSCLRFLFPLAEAAFERAANTYHVALERVLRRKRPFLVLLTMALAVSGWLGYRLPASFLPERNSGDFSLAVELPAGTPLEQTKAAAAELSALIAPLPMVRTVYAQVGETETTLAALKDYSAANTARLRVMLVPSRHGRRDMQLVKERVRQRLDTMENTTYVFEDEGIGLSEILASNEAPFTLGVVAEKAADALAVAEHLLPRIAAVEGLTDVEMDRVLGNPTVEITLDREQALRFGLEPEALAGELRNRVQGTVATTFNEVEQRVDIAVRLPLDQRYDLAGVLASPIELPGGRTVPLGTFVRQEEDRPVREVVRRDQRRQITISADRAGRGLDAIWKDVERILAETPQPGGVAFVTGGEQAEIRESFLALGWALLLSVLLVYMILAAQFESFLDPLIISAVLPIGVMGALLALLATGHGVNVMSLIGLIALLGIAVNDAIVKVDTIRRLRAGGLGGRTAILEASRLRFRPIIMTTLTTVLALIPMAVGLGTGDQMQQPLAITLMGGLTVATALTLFMTPCVYEILHRRLDRDYEQPRSTS